MADRMTKRERKEEARKARLEERKRAARRAQLRRIWSIVVVLLLALGAFGLNRLTTKDDRAALAAVSTVTKAAGCTDVQSPANEGREHIAPPATATYESNPPASGPHYNAAGQGPLPTGVSPTEFPYEGMVHNLEHGHVAFLWKADVPTPAITAIQDVINEDAQWLMGGPNTKMTQPIAMVAWDRLVTCDGTGDAAKLKAAVERFVKEYKNKAPESAPGVARPTA